MSAFTTYRLIKPPILSGADRNRRWARIRELMHERRLEGLGAAARKMYDAFISDCSNEDCVLFPYHRDTRSFS